MKLELISISSSVNKAFLTQCASLAEINLLSTNYNTLLNSVQVTDSEETIKDFINRFLNDTYYKDRFAIKENVNNIDLVILNGPSVDDKIGVLIETKSLKAGADMIAENHLNAKAFYELIQYYLEERVVNENLEIKHLIITNSHDWFVFNANEFERIFYLNKDFLKNYKDWYNGRLGSKNKDWFYNELAKPFVENEQKNIVCSYFQLSKNKTFSESQWIELYKIFSPEHLLKLPFQNDSNTLNRDFYNELLHILGLYETKDLSRQIVRLKPKDRNAGSFLENTIHILQSDDLLANAQNLDQFGVTEEEQIFSIALELCITWLNRILFLKLLESQQLLYNDNKSEFAFLNTSKIRDFEELRELFFEVLALTTDERQPNIQKKYCNIPYLNSSLFEQTAVERQFVRINHLKQHLTIPIFATTVLKDETGRRIVGEKTSLAYLFDFLDSYDFASDNKLKIQETSKTIINSAVLGLIFEKINGYKEGSFYTPGFITMYMCSDTLRKTVIQKFNAVYHWKCETITQLYNKLCDVDLESANKTFNKIRLCDPAVGSGHFLVSALNELLAIKSELGILCDANFKKHRDMYCEVQNDELFINYDDALFLYDRKDREKQRIQETFFNEKRILIENCLFGVDINPKSVQICRLRLWIELLKNTYYTQTSNFKELETLPNIDINIKTGNSLVSRFSITGAGFSNGTLQKMQLATEKYKDQVKIYKATSDKKTKQQTERSIAELKKTFAEIVNPTDKDYIKYKELESELGFAPMTFSKEEQLQWIKKTDSLQNELKTLKTKYDDKLKTVYGNAFEWRFEFPEVLDENGNFAGFDLIIGNPPYFSVSKFSKPIQQYFAQAGFQTYSPSTDIYCLFFELSSRILTKGGFLSFITSNQWLQTEYGIKLKEVLLKTSSLQSLINFGGLKVFDHATVDTSILSLQNSKNNQPLEVCHFKNDFTREMSIQKYFDEYKLRLYDLKPEKWYFENKAESILRAKIKASGKPLKDWKIEIKRGIVTGFNDAFIIDEKTKNDIIYRGIVTGFNEAFIIDEKTKNELVAKNKNSEQIIKQVLRGRDLRKFAYKFANLYLINTHNGLKKNGIEPINVPKEYPAIYEHLQKFETQLKLRADQGDTWMNLRNCTYFPEFAKPKLIYPETTVRRGEFSIDTKGMYLDKTCFMITGEHLYWINAILSSKLMEWYLESELRLLGKNTIQYSKLFIEEIPIPKVDAKLEKEITKLIDKIMNCDQNDSQREALINELDCIVFKLFGLTEGDLNFTK